MQMPTALLLFDVFSNPTRNIIQNTIEMVTLFGNKTNRISHTVLHLNIIIRHANIVQIQKFFVFHFFALHFQMECC